jgi:hypothetical protein
VGDTCPAEPVIDRVLKVEDRTIPEFCLSFSFSFSLSSSLWLRLVGSSFASLSKTNLDITESLLFRCHKKISSDIPLSEKMVGYEIYLRTTSHEYR